MRWPDISAQTTPPNVLELNDFSNLPAQAGPVFLILKNQADLSGTALRALTCPSPTLTVQLELAPDDE